MLATLSGETSTNWLCGKRAFPSGSSAGRERSRRRPWWISSGPGPGSAFGSRKLRVRRRRAAPSGRGHDGKGAWRKWRVGPLSCDIFLESGARRILRHGTVPVGRPDHVRRLRLLHEVRRHDLDTLAVEFAKPFLIRAETRRAAYSSIPVCIWAVSA